MAYRRENGRVGVRNHVVILPVDDISNAACEAVANNIKGTMALPHAYGRLQFGEDLDLHFRTMIGTGANPNVAACVVIGIEPGWTQRIVDGIAKTGKPVAGLLDRAERRSQDDHGRLAQGQGVRALRHRAAARGLPLSDLWVSTKCGESDTTTGLGSCPTVGNMYDKLIPEGIYGCFGETSEITGRRAHLQGARRHAEVGERWYKMWKAYQDDVIEAHKVDDLSDSQPTKGNIEGGLTTIEEKALGNLEKIGRSAATSTSSSRPRRRRRAGPLLHGHVVGRGRMRDADGGGGYVVHTFPTGQGNVIGNPIVPVIKITANPRTVRTMSEHVDVDVSGILRREMTIDEAGDALIDMIIRTANGRNTAAEALGSHREVRDDQALPQRLTSASPIRRSTAPSRTASALALRRGSATMSVTRSHHCGALSYHVDRLAREGLVALMFANAPAAIAPWGGATPIFGTNPIAFAAPRTDGAPLVIDLSLSRVARGKVMHAKKTGVPIPEGWALDRDGQPTTDPDAALDGSMIPIGGPKGTALALMVEIFASAMTGATPSHGASSFFNADGPPPGVGQFLIALRPPDPVAFGQRLAALLSAVLAVEGARLPGSRRETAIAKAETDGIEVPTRYLDVARRLAGDLPPKPAAQ
jgi:(2R)-sulfolactate sulfo-lyase subunit beta